MRYFFDFSGANGWNDGEGVDLADLDVARLEAARACGDWLRDHAETLLAPGSLTVIIRNEAGAALDRIDVRWMAPNA